MKTKFNSEYDLLLNKILEVYNMIVVFRSVFHKNNKRYPQVFLGECLYRLAEK